MRICLFDDLSWMRIKGTLLRVIFPTVLSFCPFVLFCFFNVLVCIVLVRCIDFGSVQFNIALLNNNNWNGHFSSDFSQTGSAIETIIKLIKPQDGSKVWQRSPIRLVVTLESAQLRLLKNWDLQSSYCDTGWAVQWQYPASGRTPHTL